MNEALLVSNIVLWVAVIVLACVVAALARQLGVLYERVAPAGALMLGKGPTVGEHAPVIAVDDLDGVPHEIGTPGPRATLLFFLSPTCPVCKELLPALRSAARRESDWLAVVLASDGPRDEHATFRKSERLTEFPYVLSPALGVTYQVGKLPYAVLIDADGIVRAKGLVNTREHLESLFEAKERGVGSLQELLGAVQ
jgi:methylamine dehydrogenase accessory protein MauD